VFFPKVFKNASWYIAPPSAAIYQTAGLVLAMLFVFRLFGNFPQLAGYPGPIHEQRFLVKDVSAAMALHAAVQQRLSVCAKVLLDVPTLHSQSILQLFVPWRMAQLVRALLNRGNHLFLGHVFSNKKATRLGGC